MLFVIIYDYSFIIHMHSYRNQIKFVPSVVEHNVPVIYSIINNCIETCLQIFAMNGNRTYECITTLRLRF